jgi:hypothetical protein
MPCYENADFIKEPGRVIPKKQIVVASLGGTTVEVRRKKRKQERLTVTMRTEANLFANFLVYPQAGTQVDCKNL